MTVVRWLVTPPPQWAVRLFVLGLVTVALIGSLLPGMGPPDTHGTDKIVHVLGYTVLAYCLSDLRGMKWGWALALALALGGGIEVLQSFIPDREGSWTDFMAGGGGVVLGLALHAARGRVRAWTHLRMSGISR